MPFRVLFEPAHVFQFSATPHVSVTPASVCLRMVVACLVISILDVSTSMAFYRVSVIDRILSGDFQAWELLPIGQRGLKMIGAVVVTIECKL